MAKIMRSLPPLTALKVFETAGKHLSFTEAAKQLHVTQGAVSRQIKQLEDYLAHFQFGPIQTHIQAICIYKVVFS